MLFCLQFLYILIHRKPHTASHVLLFSSPYTILADKGTEVCRNLVQESQLGHGTFRKGVRPPASMVRIQLLPTPHATFLLGLLPHHCSLRVL